MWQGPMVDVSRLIDGARPALSALFSVYQEQRQRGDLWRQGHDSDFSSSAMADIFDVAKYSGAYSSAHCIAIIADNVARVWAFALFGDEHERKRFGRLVNSVRLGKALWAAGNAVRHYKEALFYKETAQTLEKLGVVALDESAALSVLDVIGIHAMSDLVSELESLCDAMETKAEPDWRTRFAERIKFAPFF